MKIARDKVKSDKRKQLSGQWKHVCEKLNWNVIRLKYWLTYCSPGMWPGLGDAKDENLSN